MNLNYQVFYSINGSLHFTSELYTCVLIFFNSCFKEKMLGYKQYFSLFNDECQLQLEELIECSANYTFTSHLMSWLGPCFALRNPHGFQLRYNISNEVCNNH